MNITVEDLAPCRKLVRVELDAQAVDAAFDAVTKDYQKQASLPGFRPGKAPRNLVIKKYEADIRTVEITSTCLLYTSSSTVMFTIIVG